MKPRRPDQRTRILEAIRLVVFEQGYLGAKIGEITSRAGVSRATFYEHFDSKESCFLAAYDLGAVVTCERIAAAVALGRGRRASRAAITALVGLAEAEPHTFMCLTHEATVAGPTALSKREELLEELGRLISDAEAADASGRAPNIPPRVLLGAAVRTVGMCIRREDADLSEMLDGLLAWAELYKTPISSRSWVHTELEPRGSPGAGKRAPTPRFPAPEVPRGRHRLPVEVVRQIQRERILIGTAAAVSARGYEHTRVADIVTAAGVSRDVFYDQMGSKREALEQATKLFFERSVATFAGAFFARFDPWSERVWIAGAALGEYLQGAPALTRLALIDAYSPDPQAGRDTDELLLGIAAFIEQCASASPDGSTPPLAVQAILAALIEAVLGLLARDRAEDLRVLLPFAIYMIVVPFVGTRLGEDFVKKKLAARGGVG